MASSRTTRRQRRATERTEGKRRKKLITLAAGAAVAGAAGVSAEAATITVNSLADTTVAADAKCTLREAINNANTDSDTTGGDCVAGSGLDVIDLSSLSGTIALQNASGYYALGIETSMTLNGPASNGLSISGGNATAIFYMYNGDPAATPIDVTLNHLTIENGYNQNFGGAILALSPAGINLSINNSLLQNNVSGGSGGALAFFSFSATGPFGAKYGPASPGSLTITNTTFANNAAFVAPVLPTDQPGGGSGGAIAIKYAGSGTVITMDHITVTGNDAVNAGGGIVGALFPGSSVQLRNSVITGNTAGQVGDTAYYQNSGPGGGVAFASKYLPPPPPPAAAGGPAHAAVFKGGLPLKPRATAAPTDPTVTIVDSTISGNVSDEAGGGVYAAYLGLTIDRTTLSGNSALYGGGVALDTTTATITNSTIANNIATYYGGGVAAQGSTVTINNTTITGNTAAVGGGAVFYYDGSAPSTITNSIVANNTPSQVENAGAAPVTVSFSDIFPADAAPTWIDGGGNISADPLLAALAPNGTPNQGANNTNAPQVEIQAAGSPVIDKGNTAAAAGATDERGAVRVQGAAVDMGAVEVAPVVVTSGTITTSPTVTVNESAGTITITLTRSGGTTGDIVVNFSTTNGTAIAPGDYTTTTGSVTFPNAGATTQTITIPITVDSIGELAETFKLNLSTPTSGATVGTPLVTITITDVAPIPTLAFWMKLMLALTCAGVGVVMLRNGRILVVMLAAGIAIAAAPPLDAAPVAKSNAAPRRHRDPASTGTITSVVATKGSPTVTITIGTNPYVVQRNRVRVFKVDGFRRPGNIADLTPGAAVLVRAMRKPDGSVKNLRLGVFSSLETANAALTRLQSIRRHP